MSVEFRVLGPLEVLLDGAPPTADRAHKTLQMVVARLRKSLGAANRVRTVPGGVAAWQEAVDIHRSRNDPRADVVAARVAALG
ncbi:hypothetical protein AB0M48_20005 [Lentzea sp. NPDC051208]|uniref:hypothetical protein n=1 Tax=Lentzea sp. NPDC051208 TaxID=3154642 RepID=UPI00343A7852